MKRVLALAAILLLLMSVPAGATTDWVTKGRAGTGGHANLYGATSMGLTQAAIIKTVNRVDGVRVRFRSTDGVGAQVGVYARVMCANGSEKELDRYVTTKADKGWTYLTLFSSSDTVRGQCAIMGVVTDDHGKKGSPLEIEIQTTTY